MKLPEYRNPPINEVVTGVEFEPLESLTLPYIGLYWTTIKDKYPSTEERAPIGPLPDQQLKRHWALPLPRTWFISEDKTHLVQIQNGRFICNWRKQKDGDEYPRYENLIDKFWALLQGFKQFVEDKELGDFKIKNCELTYINHIYYNQLMKSTCEAGNIFPDLKWRKDENRFLPDCQLERWNLSFPLPEDYGTLSVDLKPAKRIVDKLSLLRFDLIAKGLGQKREMEDIRKWYDCSHEYILNAFADLTSKKAQESLWERDN